MGRSFKVERKQKSNKEEGEVVEQKELEIYNIAEKVQIIFIYISSMSSSKN
jgi:hypothetical protein